MDTIRSAISTVILTLCLCCIVAVRLDATSIIPSEGIAVNRFTTFVMFYQNAHNGKLPKQWSQIAYYDPSLEGLNSYLKNKLQFDQLYSFISPDDQSKFPEGELLLIRAIPMDWPEVWKYKLPNVDSSELTEERRAELKRLSDRQQPIRYLVYRNEQGDLDSVWWFEKDVQKMLADTGIRVPHPVPYQASALPEISPNPTAIEAIEEVIAPELATKKPAALVTEEPSEEPVEKSSNWWLWLLGAVVLAGGVLVLRRKS